MSKTADEKSALITQDIIGALEWLLSAPAIPSDKKDPGSITWKEKAQKDWIDKITRAEVDFGDAAKAGINYEKEIYRLANMHKVVGSPPMQKVIEMCIGGKFQEKISKKMTIAGEECFLYGKADVLFPGKRLIDIKTTANFKPDKFTDSFQHTLYCYLATIQDFQYVVTVWAADSTLEEPKIDRTEIIESGFFGDPAILEKKVIDKVTWFIETVKARGEWQIYKEKYCLY